MDKIRQNFNNWKFSRNRIFATVIALAVFGLVFLFASIVSNVTVMEKCPQQVTTNIDSLCNLLNERTIKMRYDIKDSVSQGALSRKLDSLSVAVSILQYTISEIEKQTSIRQDDIRQETNNIINKFNGVISWWLLLLGIICGFAPLVLAYLNHKNDSEYIKLINSNYRETLEKLKEKENDVDIQMDLLNEFKNELNDDNKKRNATLSETLGEQQLMHTYMYVTCFSRKSQFQASSIRLDVAQKLIKELVVNSLNCLQKYIENNKEYEISYWIISSVEGLELLMPYQKNYRVLRCMNKVSLELKELQEAYFKYDDRQNSEALNKIKEELERLHHLL